MVSCPVVCVYFKSFGHQHDTFGQICASAANGMHVRDGGGVFSVGLGINKMHLSIREIFVNGRKTMKYACMTC